MKIQALIAAVALAVAGGAAFAQTSSTAPAGGPAPSTTANEGKTGVASTKDAAPDAVTHKGSGKSMHKGHHAMHHHHVMRHHKHQNVSSAARDTMDSMHHMGAGPKVDLDSHDRQARMDRAYEDWKKNHG